MAYSGRTGGSGKKKFGKSAPGDRKSSPRGASSRGGDDKPAFKRRSAAGDDKPAFKRRSDDDRPAFKKPFGDKPAFKRRSSDGDDQPAFKRRSDDDRPRKSFGDKPFGDKPAFKRRSSDGDDKPAFKRRSDDDRPRKSFGDKPFGDKPAFKRRSSDGDDKPAFKRRSDDDRPRKSFGDKPFGDKPAFKRRSSDGDDKPAFKRRSDDDRPAFKKPFGSRESSRGDKPTRRTSGPSDRNRRTSSGEENEWKVFSDKDEAKSYVDEHSSTKSRGDSEEGGSLRLNKYIANTGLCSRREADDMIEAGVIKVNGKIVTELGTKVSSSDIIHYGDQPLKREKMVYILLNKPKDYITTTDDPQDRKTVLDLVSGACTERIYPVGRLDRNTTGVLLLTNDGDMAQRLMHPKYDVQKIYQVTLDTNLKKEDFDKILEGFELEDGFIKADELDYVGAGENKKEIGVVLHSGRNRIVRRMFESLGYTVIQLDRVTYAGLTKKNLPKGRWRALTAQEIGFLKMKVGGDKPVKAKFGKPKR